MSVNTVGVQLSSATLRYRDSEHATLSGLSLSLNAGKWTVLLGRSGCGKTTVLRYLAGLLDDKVEWQGTLATSDELPLTDRIAYMAQQDLLLPWLSVIDNVCLSHRFQNPVSDKALQTNQALELLAEVGLADYANAMPDQLSGGMRQRVALARTLMQDKPVVLMD
ncbi:ATP-binding cassette domain-containing protein, partial [Vibrio splendidus]